MDGATRAALGFGVGLTSTDAAPRVLARTAAGIVDLASLGRRGLVSDEGWWEQASLDRFLAAGRAAWAQVVAELSTPVIAELDSAVVDEPGLQLVMPFTVADYVDFYASEQHATNLGRILRPGQDPLPPNWRHLPIGYHGRSGTVVVSGTPVRRPCGQRRVDSDDPPTFGPTERLDVEVEVGFVVGAPSVHGEPVGVDGFRDHVFGVCLLNDWSARDIQAWEGQPLGPFLGKSFATSVSPWVVPLEALDAARVSVASAQAPLLPYLRESGDSGYDISLELSVNGTVVSRPPYASMFWSPAQMLAHMTVNGASLRTGDLYASGTVSGPSPQEWGSLIELTHDTEAGFLADGDEVVISATAPGPDGEPLSLGEVRGTVLPAPPR